MSISWTAVSTIAPSARSSHRREVAADRVVRGDVGDVVGGDLEVVQVGLQAVAAGDRGDRLVVGVHHDVFALAEAQREHAPLPPRQVAPACVCLLVQVLRRLAPRQLVEPDEPALRRVDQRSVLTRTGPVGREDVAGRGIAIWHGDAQDRGLDAGQRVEALIVGGRRLAGSGTPGWLAVGYGVSTRKLKDDPLAAVARRADRRAHGHALAGVERRVGHEARAVALRVAVEAPGVIAAAFAHDGDLADLRGRHAQEADLRVRVGGVGARRRRDIDSAARPAWRCGPAWPAGTRARRRWAQSSCSSPHRPRLGEPSTIGDRHPGEHGRPAG